MASSTPNEIAVDLGVSPTTVRSFLRNRYDHRPSARWHLTDDQIAAARHRFQPPKTQPPPKRRSTSKRSGRRGLTPAQRRLLAAVYHAFADSGEWPHSVPLQRDLDRAGRHLNIEELVHSMREEITGDTRRNTRLRLTLPGLARVRDARADVQAFLGLVGMAYQQYMTSDAPVLTSDVARAAMGLTPLAVRRLLQLIDAEPPFGGGWSSSDGTEWQRDVSPEVRYFRRASTLRKYLTAKEHLRRLPLPSLDDPGQQSKWAQVDARLRELQSRLSEVAAVDDLQDIGRRTRELVADAVSVLARDSRGILPRGARDSKRALDAYLTANAGGTTGKELRGLLRALLALANAETHRSRGSRASAFANVQAATALVRILQALEVHGFPLASASRRATP